jgi:N12 class adenine-specific DNA methylase
VELTQVGAGKNVVGLSVNGVRVEPGVNTADTANRIDATLAAGFDKAQEKADTESKEARDDTEPQGSNEGNGGAIRSLAPATSQSGDQALAGMAAEDGGDAGQGKQADLFGAGRGRKSATRDKRADGGRDAAPRSKRADAETVHPPGAGERSFGEPGTGRVEPAAIPGKNFKITKDLKLGEGSEEVKFQDNLAAISTLKRIEGEQRRATAEEQRTLARYVGWGGLANAFANPVTGDIREGWQGRVKDLAGLLTDNELTVARNSTKAAHYTSEAVASQMWEAVKRLGFKRGNVLEPSMGIGNFIGLTPEGVTANVMGIEYDPITARIGKLLYPQATVIHSGFQQVPLPEGVFDLVIGNPPFGQESLNFQHSPHLNRHSIHNQFFLAGIDALRPGGIQAMVVSRYLMDSKDSGARDALAAEAKLLGVVRLPESAFKENARTDVVTDIIFLQKKTEEEIAATEKEEAPAWTKSTEIEVNGEQIAVNKYFQNNPRAVIGTMTTASSQFSGASLVVKLEKGADLAKLINERTGQILPAGVFTQESTADQARDHFETMRDGMEIALAGHEDASIAFNDLGELVQVHERETEGGDFVLAKRVIGVGSPWSPHLAMDKDGNWFREVDKLDEKGNKIKVADENGKLTKRNAKKRQVFKDVAEIPQSMTMSKLDYGRLRDAVSLLDELVAQVNLEISDAPSLEIEGNRKQLRRAYDAFVKKHDRVNAPVINKLISDLPNGPLLMALETVYKPPIRKDRAEKLNTKPRPAIVKEAAILDERVVFPYESPTSVESASDALAVVLSESGRVDLGRVADLLGQGQDEVIKALHHEAETPLIFLDPETQEWETADEYLGGNVVKKLAAAKGDSGYPKNVDALEAVQPKAWTADQVTPTLGSTWIPTDVYAGFIASLTGKPAKVNFSPLTNTYAVQGEGGTPKAQNWNTPKRNVVEIIEAVLNSRPIRITETIGYGSEKRTVTDQDNTDLANEKGEEIREAFDDWVFQDAGRRKQLVDIFNQKFNVRVVKQRDGQHLKLPGKVPDSVIKMRRHQLNGIWRGIVDRFVLYDHAVGAGKTFTGIARAMERRRMGLSRKPLVVVPNHLVEQFAADAYKLYPGAKVLAAGSKDLNPKKRRRMLGKIATGEWDLVIMPHSSFKFVGISPDTESRFLEEQLRLAEQAIAEAQQQAEEDGLAGHRKPITVKEAERLRDTIQGRLDKLRTRGNKKDRMLSFEQLGVDDLTIDEAHEFKNLFYHSKLSVRGMNPKEGSARAYDLWTKVRVLQESKTGSVAFMTGTPISNSAVEMYGLMRYLAADVLADMNLEHFDAWRSQFTTVTTKYEPTDSGRGLKEVNRIGRDWSNMRALMDAYYTFSDSVSNGDIQAWYSEDNDGARFPIPEVKGGGRQQVNVAPTEAQERIIQEVVARYEGLDGIKDVKERNKERLRLMDRARKVSLDVRVVDPATDSKERGGKLDAVARQVHQIYHEWREDKGTQLVFLDRSVPKAKGDAGKIQKYDALLRDLEAAERKGDDDKARAVIGKLEKYDYNEMQELKIAQTGSWNAYRQIKENLVGLGIPENEIRFIQEANTDEQKKTMFDEVNAGQIRVLIGSTPRLGAGTNVQERLVALHHVDVTWKPSDIEQREGRIIRQGNSLFAKYGGSFKVIINAYTTDTTVDQRLWDLNATKMRMINGIRKYNGDFNMEFVDEDSVSMAEIAAHASGNPLQLERVQLAAEIDRLNRSKRSFARQQWGQKDALEEAEANIKILPETIRALAPEAEKIAAEIAMVAEEVKSRTVTIDGKEYDRGPWGSNAHDALAEKRDQAKKKKEKFEADINGKVFTSFQDASAAIDDVMGDGANFDVELDGEKFIRHRRAIGKVVELANAVIDKEGKGAEVDYTPLAKMRAYGVDIDLAIQVVDDGKGRTIEFHFTGKKEANGQPLTLVRSIYEANLGVDYYAHSAMYGMFSRPLNDVTSIPNRLKQSRKRLAEAKEMAPELRKLVDKPYPKEQELSDKKDRLNAVEQELSNSAAPSKGKTTDDGEVKLSQSSSPRSGQLSTARTLQSIVDSYLTSSGRRDLQVSVVQTVDQLRAGLVLSEGVSGNVEGAFDPQSGKVFLVADNIATTEAWGRILHEITHKTRAEQGWGGVFGREAETILNEIDKRLAAGATAWKKAEQQARQARTSAENLREETITYFLAEQANSNQSLWRRIVNAIRAWAVRVGLKRKVSDADIVALAENSVQSRARSTVSEMESAGDTVPAFSESNDIRYSQAELAAAAKAFFSKLQQVTSSAFQGMKAQSVMPFLVKNGVKKTELEAVGVAEFLAGKKPTDKVTQTELENFVRANTVELEDVVLGAFKADQGIEDAAQRLYRTSYSQLNEAQRIEVEETTGIFPETDGVTHFSQYTEPGAVEGSYREMFVTAPKALLGQITKQDLAEAASIRAEVAAFQAEMASKYGFSGLLADHLGEMSDEDSATFARLKEANRKANKIENTDQVPDSWSDGHPQYSDVKNPVVRIRFNEVNADGKRILRIEEMQGPNPANQAKMPGYFKDNIYQLGVKRVLAYAKENGFDGVALATRPGRSAGETQADRYSLEKQIESVSFEDKGAGKVDLWAKETPEGGEKKLGTYAVSDLGPVVGKDLSEKIAGDVGAGKERNTYSGLDLKVGGEGLIQLYDKTIPAMLEAYGKGKMAEIEAGGDPEGSKPYAVVGYDIEGDRHVLSTHDTEAEAGRAAAANNEFEDAPTQVEPKAGKHPMPYLSLTGKTPGSYPLFSKQETPLAEPSPKAAAVLRKINTDLKNAEKKAITRGIDKYEDLVKALRDDKVDIYEKQKALEAHIKANLPAQDRAKVMHHIKNIATRKTEAGRERMLGLAIRRVNEAHEEVDKREALKKVGKLIKSKAPKRTGQGVRDARRMGAEANRLMDQVHEARAMSQEEGFSEVAKILEEMDSGLEPSMEQIERLAILQSFAGLESRSVDDIKNAGAMLKQIIAEGRADWMGKEEERRERMTELRDQFVKEVTGGQGLKSLEQERSDKAKRGTWQAIKEGLRSFDDMHQSFEFLLDKIARGDKESGTLKSKITEHFTRLAFKATETEHAGVQGYQEMLRDKLTEIYGVKGGKLAKILSRNTLVKPETGVTRNTRKGGRVNVPLSQNQAYKLWQMFQQPSIQNEMLNQGYDQTTLEQLEGFIDPKAKAWAQWQVEEFYPHYREGVNDVYKSRFYVDMPQIEGYSPISRVYEGQTVDEALLGEGGMYRSLIAGAVKTRTENSRGFNLLDGDSVLLKHIVELEHFKAWALPMREMRSIFGVETSQRAVKQYHGGTANTVLKKFMDDFSSGGIDRANTLSALDKIRGNFTRAVVGANPVVFLKQLSSIPAYAMEIPVKDFTAGFAYALSHPTKVYKTLMQSKTMQARYKMGFERDIMLAMQRNTVKTVSGTRTLSDTLMLATKLGDKLAIISGGWAVYDYHHKKLLKEGMSEEKAHQEALYRFDRATKRSQQAGDTMDLAQLQRMGSLGKLFTMFMTAPLAYYRNTAAGLRNLAAGRGSKAENVKRVAISWFVLQMLFQWVASAFDWDDEAMGRAALVGPLNGLFLVRDLIGSASAALLEGKHYWSTGTPPPLTTMNMTSQVMRRLNKAMKKGLSDEELAKLFDELAEITGNLTGIPYGPVSRVAGGVKDAATGKTDHPIRRAMGYSERVLGTKDAEYREQASEVMTVHDQYLAEKDRTRRQEIKKKKIFGLIPLVKEAERALRKLRKIKKIREERGEDTTLLDDQIERIQKKVIARYRQTL